MRDELTSSVALSASTLTRRSLPLAATIPLPGIDVPFHSKYLWSGVSPFLKYLSKKVSAADLNPELLVGLYIPNLIADPFQISREYAQKIFDQTGASDHLRSSLARGSPLTLISF